MDHLSEVEKLRACTERHYNCAQSLLVPFSDVTGISREKADELGSLFGAGMHSGETCGTLTSAAMILGMAGYSKEASTALIREFRKKHNSVLCRELLGASAKAGIPRKVHCDGLVFEVCKWLDETLGAGEKA